MRFDEQGNHNLSWNAQTIFSKCQRKAELRYHEGLEKIRDGDSEKLIIGGIFHAGIAGYIEGVASEDVPNPLQFAIGVARRYKDYITDENRTVETLSGEKVYDSDYYYMLDSSLEVAIQMLETYIPHLEIGSRYRPVTHAELGIVRDGVSPKGVAVELEFDYPLQEGINVQGYIDAVLYDTHQAEYVLVDWKTTSRFPHGETSQIDGQLHFYATAMREAGLNVNRGIFVYMKTKTPRSARINKNNTISVATQATTWDVWMSTLPESLQEQVTKNEETLETWQKWADEKLSVWQDFIRFDEVIFTDQSIESTRENTLRMSETMREAQAKLDAGQELPATLSRYGCEFCEFKKLCIAIRYGEDFSHLKSEFGEAILDYEDKHAN